MAGPFAGHTGSVFSVALSPDEQHITSGSSDNTIRVWNATTGETVAGPFAGHIDSVNSVAFSPDGQHIISGSSDNTIHVWNATTGETVAGPFAGHTDSVNSVVFSPDKQQIISGLDDSTICLSNITTEETERQVTFTEQSVIKNDGWIHGANGELLLWIPQLHRKGLHRPNNIWISGTPKTQLDLSNFVHGTMWSTCYNIF